MSPVILAMVLAASPTVIRIEMTDALRLPSGFVTPPAKPLVIFVRAPAAWVKGGTITDAGKQAVLAKLYGGPNWQAGNEDGSTYVVQTFSARVLKAGEAPDGDAKAWWYEVTAAGALEKRGPGFTDPAAPKPPGSLIDHAVPGSVWQTGPSVGDKKALVAWLAAQKGEVKLAVKLTPAVGGYSGRGAVAGALTFDCDDSALGISLSDRARQACGDAKVCELWVIGTWTGTGLKVTKAEGAVTAREREVGNMPGFVWHRP